MLTYLRMAGLAIVLAALLGLGVAVYRWGGNAPRAELAQLEAELGEQKAAYRAKVAEAQNDVAGLRVEVEALQALIAQDKGSTDVQIEVVARPDRQCLSPGVGRLLRDAIARANARLAEGRGAEVQAPAGPAPADAGVDERAIARWSNAVIAQYSAVRSDKQYLAGVVEAAPCIKIEEDR